jgi:hypothetical protein
MASSVSYNYQSGTPKAQASPIQDSYIPSAPARNQHMARRCYAGQEPNAMTVFATLHEDFDHFHGEFSGWFKRA